MGDATYTYTPDGYLACKHSSEGTTTYAYTAFGELASLTLPDGREVAYTYDASGRRTSKAIEGSVTERYLWADTTRLLATYDGAGALQMRFLYADARVPFGADTPAGRIFFAYDQTGSLRTVTAEDGSLLKSVDRDSFGNLIADSAPELAVPLGFAGGLYDADTGLTLFGVRDYDAELGRWIAKDPIGFAGGDANLYGYCLGDPVNLVDPSGLNAMTLALPVAGTAALVDGPVPVGDVVALLILASAVVWDLLHPVTVVCPITDEGAWPYDPPGWDPDSPPVPDWVRHPSGNWVHPDGTESLHPDLGNAEEGPHWDWHRRGQSKERIDPDTGEALDD